MKLFVKNELGEWESKNEIPEDQIADLMEIIETLIVDGSYFKLESTVGTIFIGKDLVHRTIFTFR